MTTPDPAGDAPSPSFTVRRFSPWVLALVATPIAAFAVGALSQSLYLVAAGFAVMGALVLYPLSAVTHLHVTPGTDALTVHRARVLFVKADEGFALSEVRNVTADPIDDSDLLTLTLRYKSRSVGLCDGTPAVITAAARWLKDHQRAARKSSASASD